jgi:long-chain acyl-CoA synthetase
MTFLETILDRLQKASTSPVMRELRGGRILSVTGGELLAMVQQARQFLVASGLVRRDRCVLLAPNSIRWAALDLAMMAEGIVVVPLYARQAPSELVVMMKDAGPARIFCFDQSTVTEIRKLWPNAPEISLLDNVFNGIATTIAPSLVPIEVDPAAILYTSGTSGESKGVVLTAGNLEHVVRCTNRRLDELMGKSREADRVFHYLYFSFAGSLILLLSALARNSVLTLSTDLSKLSDDMKLSVPDYFLNVPMVLERLRAAIEKTIRNRGKFATRLFTNAQKAYVRRHDKVSRGVDSLWLTLANWTMFPAIRKTVGPNVNALICGSAPLAVETQLFFLMLGIPVLQVYGLSETTAICTMDDPNRSEAGRVGAAISGVEMILGENGEILVRGPNIFAGYWQRPAETAKALEGGWFHTGDQGDVDAYGNWLISGRLKNLIILNSGHNIPPEPLEEALMTRLPQVQQAVLVGNHRSFLSALVAIAPGKSASGKEVQSAIDSLNLSLPHYKRIRSFYVVPEPFSVERGLMTTNGKYRRDAIAAHFAVEIAQLYKKEPVS